MFMAQVFAGIPVYLALAYLSGASKTNKKKQKEYFKKMFSPQQIAYGSFQRAAWSSFIPTVLDSGSQLILGESLGGIRSTGSTVGLLDLNGNPTSDFLAKLTQAAGGVAKAPFKGGFSEREIDAIKKSLPLQNAFGFSEAMSAIFDLTLPKSGESK